MVRSKFPVERRKGGRTSYDEASLEDLPQRPAPTMAKPERPTGSDKGEPHGAKGAKGSGHAEVDSSMKEFIKKRRKLVAERGK